MKVQDFQDDPGQGHPLNETGLWSASHLEAIIDRRLRVLSPSPQVAPQLLHSAIHYTLLAPGKRLRPMLTLLTSFHFGRRDLLALDCACAIEMVHAASLVMDDLPAMDDAAMRRGQPTLHRQFGEDIALLTSIGLVNLAYGIVASCDGLTAETRVGIARSLSRAVGSNGLVGGQVMDLRLTATEADTRQLERVNEWKTGTLFVAAAETGALIANADVRALDSVRDFALELGLAFQIADDMIDSAAYAGQTGKDTGKDAGKPRLGSVLGPQAARGLLERHKAECRRHLREMGGCGGNEKESPLAAFVGACFVQLEK